VTLLEEYMTNRELLEAPQETLSPAQRRQQTMLRVELTPLPCPACRQPTDALSAAGIDVDAYRSDAGQASYRCPHCGAQLEQAVPFVATGPGWHWRLGADWLAERLCQADLYDREHPEGAGRRKEGT
jgi:hypothetical protein